MCFFSSIFLEVFFFSGCCYHFCLLFGFLSFLFRYLVNKFIKGFLSPCSIMIVRELVMRNIRSYVDERIVFPTGSILLAGDVGSGKTSILLSIEFALFGLLRGELPADHLLRHGTDKGAVKLSFAIDGKEVIVERTLRKDSNGIKQGPGSLVIDGASEQLTPVELRARLLDLLGYSQDLVTKAKSLIFRYTVYTPQEEMKRILFESSDDRLETLRRVFGIDQYKRVRDNVLSVSRQLRAESKALVPQLEEIPQKRKELEGLLEDVESLVLRRKELEDVLAQRKSILVSKRKHFDSLEAAKSRFDDAQAKVRRLQDSLDDRRQAVHRVKDRLAHLENDERCAREELSSLKKEYACTKDIVEDEDKARTSGVDSLEGIDAALVKVQSQERLVLDRIGKARAKEGSLAERSAAATRSLEKLQGLVGQCPLCEQEVPHEHKERLSAVQKEVADEVKVKQVELSSFLVSAQEKLSSLRHMADALRTRRSVLQRSLQRLATLKERVSFVAGQREDSVKELSEVEKSVVAVSEEFAQAKKVVSQQEFSVDAFKESRDALEAARKQVQESEVSLAGIVERQKGVASLVDRLQKDIVRLDALRLRSSRLQSSMHWLGECFSPAVERVERAVFASVHQEFSGLFSSWFDQIIADESFAVRLDGGFSPVISLNGYETSVESLSGGEKTAVALAYRLALNQVISEFVGTIRTRDLLILDEPTDGFSAHQLDRMRDVVDQLRLSQLIIVSHESRVEGFVQHVLRVVKQEGVSRLAS